ncbi:hypothetical protein AURDEDRAFT_167550 [Auricularia subglabra TFB-10046 SS5]|nr:hypothetical protein AURDEDRAFT_167550 [Auricularia subglabra TFB-10046 SS5]
MTDPRRTYSSYPPVTSTPGGQGQPQGQPTQAAPTQAPAPGQQHTRVTYTEQGMFHMSPLPGDVPSPHQPRSAHPTPPTPAYTTPPMPAGYTRSAAVPMPATTTRTTAGPPGYAQATQGYTCPICRTQVPAHLVAEHKRVHEGKKNPQVGLGYSFFAPRNDQGGDGSGSGGSSGGAFYNPAAQTSTRGR